MRRNLDPSPLPDQRMVVRFLYPELSKSKQRWWLVIEPNGDIDLCWSDPGFDIDLYVNTDLRTMTAIWMGLTTVKKERERMDLIGRTDLAASMQNWLGLSPFAIQNKLAP